jgi:hypothetical protein
VRALALKWFGAIARHPEAGTDCRICESGAAQFCGDCFIEEIGEYRAMLRAQGNPISGEPAGQLATILAEDRRPGASSSD